MFNPRTGERKLLPSEGGRGKRPQTPSAPRNIDPLSAEGIAAAVKREQQLAANAPKKPPEPSAAEQKNAVLYAGAEQANKGLTADKTPGGISQAYTAAMRTMLPKSLENMMLSGKQEQFAQSGDQFTDMVLRVTSGANTPEKEIARYLNFLIPKGFESKETWAQKEEARNAFLAALKAAGGDAITPDAAADLLRQHAGGGSGRGAAAVARLRGAR